MNRRSFLGFLGLAAVAPKVVAETVKPLGRQLTAAEVLAKANVKLAPLGLQVNASVSGSYDTAALARDLGYHINRQLGGKKL